MLDSITEYFGSRRSRVRRRTDPRIDFEPAGADHVAQVECAPVAIDQTSFGETPFGVRRKPVKTIRSKLQ